jgi:hypothetical protein
MTLLPFSGAATLSVLSVLSDEPLHPFLYFPNFLMTLLPFVWRSHILSVPFRSFRRDIVFPILIFNY